MESIAVQPASVVIASDVASTNPLVRVCSLLNAADAEYLVMGAWAMILNNIVRATEDVDLLIAGHPKNYERVITALAGMEDHAAAELTPRDFEDNVVIKIADEVEVDVSTRAWTVTYEEARPRALEAEIDGVRIRYLSVPDLIKSKQTFREQDRADIERLKRLL